MICAGLVILGGIVAIIAGFALFLAWYHGC